MKVSIAIPNYQGRKLLEGNLPSIISAGADEIIINDDASSDGSIQFIKDNYPQIKLLTNDKNQRFIYSVNKLVNEAVGDIVVLLNNDVSVNKNFLKPLLKHFKNEKVFAVNCHEEGEGYAKAYWKDGFFGFQRGGEEKSVHKSSWASGGSAAYRKSAWQKLGGFDPIFKPGYWEDIDLSYRALKVGYEVLWEPDAKVWHNHGTTFSKIFKKRKIDWIQQRNQLLFIWKNIDDKELISEHRKALTKRLLGGMRLGYWTPFLWALYVYNRQMLQNNLKNVRTDMEAIEYVNS